MPRETNPLTVRRDSFNEDDIRELTREVRFLACIDAYSKGGGITLADVLLRLGGDISDPPRFLSVSAFSGLAHEVAKRIQEGRIPLPSNIRDDYAFAYAPGTAGEDPTLT
jgi:hypothetical protein